MGSVVLNGIFVGLIYGLLALGLVTIYRSSRIVNFAYGETGMLAAFLFFDMRLGHTRLGADHGIVWPLVVALVVGAVIGAAMEVLIARPIRDNPTLNGMVNCDRSPIWRQYSRSATASSGRSSGSRGQRKVWPSRTRAAYHGRAAARFAAGNGGIPGAA